jgi:hypothetical protein
MLFSRFRRWIAPFQLATAISLGAVWTSASADPVVFPGAEWSSGFLVVDSPAGSKSVPFYGPEEGPSETLSLTLAGGIAQLFGSLVPHPAISASVSTTTAFQANANVVLTYHAEILEPGRS